MLIGGLPIVGKAARGGAAHRYDAYILNAHEGERVRKVILEVLRRAQPRAAVAHCHDDIGGFAAEQSFVLIPFTPECFVGAHHQVEP